MCILVSFEWRSSSLHRAMPVGSDTDAHVQAYTYLGWVSSHTQCHTFCFKSTTLPFQGTKSLASFLPLWYSEVRTKEAGTRPVRHDYLRRYLVTVRFFCINYMAVALGSGSSCFGPAPADGPPVQLCPSRQPQQVLGMCCADSISMLVIPLFSVHPLPLTPDHSQV